MESLYIVVAILALICIFGFFNEKVTKLTYEIALMLFSTIFGILILIVVTTAGDTDVAKFLNEIQGFDIHDFLMHGVLCYMLFAGSCHMKLRDFKEQARQITVLSFVCTLLGAVFYALLIYGVGYAFGTPLPLPVCLMFGSIVAPTDPIAATGILSKFGLPKKTSFLIQGESLFNDGVGVALFVCFSGMVSASSASAAQSSVIGLMLKEILGALAVAAVVTAPEDIHQPADGFSVVCPVRGAWVFWRNRIGCLRHPVLRVPHEICRCRGCRTDGAIQPVLGDAGRFPELDTVCDHGSFVYRCPEDARRALALRGRDSGEPDRARRQSLGVFAYHRKDTRRVQQAWLYRAANMGRPQRRPFRCACHEH